MSAVCLATGRRPAASCFFEVGRREIGSSNPRASSSRISGSEGIIMRMNQYGQLQGHTASVNAVSFSPAGDLLVSASDDTDIILWDWLAKSKRLSYPSGHQYNVLHARVMPFTDDSTIVTVAGDDQVRVGELKQGGEVTTRQIAEHDDRVKKVALEPGSPHILYTCGEDGLVQHFDLRSNSPIKLFTCYSFSERRRRVRLNTIAIDPQNPNYFSVGGSDEYVRLYDSRRINSDASSNMNLPVDTFCPKYLLKGRKVHITGVAYSKSSEMLVSYNDELVYLFQNNMGLGSNPESTLPENLDKLKDVQAYSGHRNSRTVKGVSFFGPNDEYVLSGSDCGNVFIWKKKGATSGIGRIIRIWSPESKKVIPLPKHANQIMAYNDRGRKVDASRAGATVEPGILMRLLRLHPRLSESDTEHEPSASDFASGGGDDEPFFIQFGGRSTGRRGRSDRRECIMA
ncbi:uncharacterized protein [Lolium perenne]|uniref:uncharacterized protein n=1 Tax=Lolium perenne TaxID=4522 RepID=UPI0021F52ADF|nr:uncharacterized protein LOC127348990 [Lolium perenne]